uniref:Aquaporin n=1 Tax=Heterorhabditis bacteriophora TaxID=37862 RepID=A0A1I7X736_HETBA
MPNVDIEVIAPLVSSIFFYTIVLAVAEASRRILDQVLSKKSILYRFLIEFIGTAQICTCVFENVVIVQHYGVSSFFIITSVLGVIFGSINRGSYGTPLAPIELFHYGEITLLRFLSIVLAEICGGAIAWKSAKLLWFYSLEYSDAHLQQFIASQNSCSLNYQREFLLVLAFEIIGSFAMRTVIPRLPEISGKYLAPAFISSLFSFAILFVGDSGLDPVVASSLFFGCAGLSTQWFILLYWASFIGKKYYINDEMKKIFRFVR